MSSSAPAADKTSSSKKQQQAKKDKERRERTRELVNGPVINRTKAQAKADQADRTAAAVEAIASNTLYARPTEINLSAAAGTWKLHHSSSGGFALSRGFLEVLQISPTPTDPSEWTIRYDGPVDLS